MAAHWEAMAEESRLLHQLLTDNLGWINLSLGGRREQDEGESEVKGSGEAEGLEEWAEEVE